MAAIAVLRQQRQKRLQAQQKELDVISKAGSTYSSDFGSNSNLDLSSAQLKYRPIKVLFILDNIFWVMVDLCSPLGGPFSSTFSTHFIIINERVCFREKDFVSGPVSTFNPFEVLWDTLRYFEVPSGSFSYSKVLWNTLRYFEVL